MTAPITKIRRNRFALGAVVATPGALHALEETQESPAKFIDRHVSGDWGELDPADRAENERSLADGDRLMSAYRTSDGTRIWIITEADRSSTCVLLPEEY